MLHKWRIRFFYQAACFMKRAKCERGGGVWRYACRPIIESRHIHGCCSHDMLQMRPRFSNVARAAQSHAPHPLGMDSLYTCPPGIVVLKCFRLLALTSGIQGKMRGLSPDRQASSLGLRTLRTHGAGSADGKAELDLDDLLIASAGRCPTAADLPLGTAGELSFPVNREIG